MRSLKGRILIAAPKLMDPNFYRAVLLMVEHGEEGAMGLVLNRPTQTRIADVWPTLSEGQCMHDEPLFYGGPCEGPLMLLHTHEAASQIAVRKGLHFSADDDHVRWLVEQDGGPIKAFAGYAGWSPGQIESELASGSWLHAPTNARAVIGRVPSWEKIIGKLTPGLIEVKIVPQDPSFN